MYVRLHVPLYIWSVCCASVREMVARACVYRESESERERERERRWFKWVNTSPRRSCQTLLGHWNDGDDPALLSSGFLLVRQNVDQTVALSERKREMWIVCISRLGFPLYANEITRSVVALIRVFHEVLAKGREGDTWKRCSHVDRIEFDLRLCFKVSFRLLRLYFIVSFRAFR